MSHGALIVFVSAAREAAFMQYKEVLTMLLSLLINHNNNITTTALQAEHSAQVNKQRQAELAHMVRSAPLL